MSDWPKTFNYTESNLDTHFLGLWTNHRVDDYGTVKAGTISRSMTVRSQVDFDREVIKLVACVPKRFGVNDFVMEGSTGFYGKITEVTTGRDDKTTTITAFWIKLLTAEDVQKNYQQTTDGHMVWRTEAEFDDIVFNQDRTYTYPVYYFAKKKKLDPILEGMTIELPLKHFNHYIRMRDLYFRDYKGSKEVHQPGE